MAAPESVDPLAGINVEQRSGKKLHARTPSMAATILNMISPSSRPADPLPPTAEEVYNTEPTPTLEKALPATPSEEKVWSAAALPRPVPLSPEKLSKSPLPTPRLKKKVPWKGKNIMVLLPLDDERGQKGKAPTPMSGKDVEKMLQEWDSLGYSTRGFNLGASELHEEFAHRQSRDIWPAAEEMDQERQRRNFRVSIPDRRLWDAYVQELNEAKLRALGVSLGDEDPPPAPSPALATLSRTSTMQYPPLPFSPPIPTSSANSSHAAHAQNPFSPVLMGVPGQSTSQSSNVGSVASPASMHAQMYGKYNPRASVSVASGEHPFGSPFQFPQQAPSPGGMWSPHQALFQAGHLARGGSPSISNFGAIMSPSSPFSQDGYFQQPDLAAHLRQQQLQNQAHLQMQARQSPRLQEIRPTADDDETTERIRKSPSKTPDATQFISHNASDSLQKEIDDAEWHLEEQFKREIDEDNYSPHSEKEEPQIPNGPKSHQRKDSGLPVGLGASRYADVKDGPELHHPQPHSRGHSLSQRPFLDEDEPEQFQEVTTETTASKGETDTTDADSPDQGTDLDLSHQRSLSNMSNPWLDSEPLTEKPAERTRGHKKTLSTLNVAAPEFKFNPSAAFKPAQLDSSAPFTIGAPFQPSVPVAPVFTMPSVGPGMFGKSAPLKVTTSKINADAPAFHPGSSEFSFSSAAPSFRPDAPAFTPMRSATDTGSGTDASSNTRKSIFGNIDLTLADIIKPVKKSKAIPIIRPDSSKGVASPKNFEDDLVFDSGGRITQGEGRIKRARGAANDANSVPEFAEPTPEPELQSPPSQPLQETSRDQSPPKEVASSKTTEVTEADKENAPSTPKPDDLRVVAPSAAVKALGRRSILQDSPDYDGKGWAPWEFQDQKHVEDFHGAAAFPVKEPKRPQVTEANDGIKSPPESTTEASSVPQSAVEPPKKHKKNSLSALAKPFDFTNNWFKFGSGESPKQAAAPVPIDPTPVVSKLPTPPTTVSLPSKGLADSRYAVSPPKPESPAVVSPESPLLSRQEAVDFQAAISPPQSQDDDPKAEPTEEQTLEDIDAVMRQLNEEPHLGINRDADTPRWHQPSPNRTTSFADIADSSPIRLQPENLMRSDAPSPSPRRFQALPGDLSSQRIFSREHDDPFVDSSKIGVAFDSPIHRLNHNNGPVSDWDDVVSQADEEKFFARTQFFDGHVNDLVGGIVSERLQPLEDVLESIQLALVKLSGRSSSRRDRRSVSGELPESDADDEDDDETQPRRSLSPKKDRRLEKIRAVVTEALNTHQATRPPLLSQEESLKSVGEHNMSILQTLEDLKEQFGQSMRLDLRGEDLRNIVEEAVERRMPPTPKPDETLNSKVSDLEARIKELVLLSQHAEKKAEDEIDKRRAAEDRLSENQRLLRISSEEEHRLRELVEERDQKLKTIEDTRLKHTMRTALLEASADNAQKNQAESMNKINALEADLREARQQAHQWQSEADKALESTKHHRDDAAQANAATAGLRRTIDSLKVQMEESARTRETMRKKLGGLQEEMAKAAREISQENAGRAKREQQLVARQEVLDARLQAEARTRERLEREIERLENGERDGMRAVNESKRLETLMSELKTELHEAEKSSLRYQREFEEARESGIAEVQRTRNYMQAEVENANHEVNSVRQELEDQMSRLRSEIDNVRLDADTAKEKFEMLFEEATEDKRKDIHVLVNKHENQMEDTQAQHDRQMGNTLEQAQASEAILLERLSLSTSKTEHLQDRVTHLEERLELAKTAALAAAQAARSNSVSSAQGPQATAAKPISQAMQLPEKISPQALRESIMVLQEQLQEREHTIESLEAKLATVDLDAPAKIAKQDDEITWLRELLAVRKGDLDDLINSASSESNDFDAASIKDAAIRLKANLQMEEQERERALTGAGLYALPNIAASLKDAATPRVQQVVGPMAAAWGNWRKNQETGTPSKNASPQSFLSGLLTPPASARTPPQPPSTASRRFTAQQLANRPRASSPRLPGRPLDRQKGKGKASGSSSGFSTPPMMRQGSYDRDAEVNEFNDAEFYDDDNTVDDSMLGAGRL